MKINIFYQFFRAFIQANINHFSGRQESDFRRDLNVPSIIYYVLLNLDTMDDTVGTSVADQYLVIVTDPEYLKGR